MVHIAPVQTHTNNVVIMFFEKPKGSPFFLLVFFLATKMKVGRLWVLICLGGDGLAAGTRNCPARAVILVFHSI